MEQPLQCIHSTRRASLGRLDSARIHQGSSEPTSYPDRRRHELTRCCLHISMASALVSHVDGLSVMPSICFHSYLHHIMARLNNTSSLLIRYLVAQRRLPLPNPQSLSPAFAARPLPPLPHPNPFLQRLHPRCARRRRRPAHSALRNTAIPAFFFFPYPKKKTDECGP